MEDSYVHLQRGSVQSVSGTVDDTYEQIHMSVQPPGKHQTQSPLTTTVKVVLGLHGVVVLLALVVAAVAIVQNQQQNALINSLEQTVHRLQTDLDKLNGTELPQSSPAGASSSTSPATPAATVSTPATTVPTASLPATPAATAPTPATTVSSTDTRLTSCAAIHSSHPSAPSGVYTIHIGGRVQGRKVWCDMVTYGGGWTRFQRRQDGSVEFNRTWNEYKSGFGSAGTEFWLGNDDLHTLTSAQPSELRVELSDWEGNHTYARYSTFRVGSQSTNYTLQVSGYSGEAGNSMVHNNNLPFSTTDRDHDTWSGRNCAAAWGGGGWWYWHCTNANLNGRYYAGGVTNVRGVTWYDRRNNWYSYKVTSMLTRPRQ